MTLSGTLLILLETCESQWMSTPCARVPFLYTHNYRSDSEVYINGKNIN
jgi:hypothetical protein